MIYIVLCFDSDNFPALSGDHAAGFFWREMQRDPAFFLAAADTVEVRGDLGDFFEKRIDCW